MAIFPFVEAREYPCEAPLEMDALAAESAFLVRSFSVLGCVRLAATASIGPQVFAAAPVITATKQRTYSERFTESPLNKLA
jgi:hypothetical protein